jgi:hypothetical protein
MKMPKTHEKSVEPAWMERERRTYRINLRNHWPADNTVPRFLPPTGTYNKIQHEKRFPCPTITFYYLLCFLTSPFAGRQTNNTYSWESMTPEHCAFIMANPRNQPQLWRTFDMLAGALEPGADGLAFKELCGAIVPGNVKARFLNAMDWSRDVTDRNHLQTEVDNYYRKRNILYSRCKDCKTVQCFHPLHQPAGTKMEKHDPVWSKTKSDFLSRSGSKKKEGRGRCINCNEYVTAKTNPRKAASKRPRTDELVPSQVAAAENVPGPTASGDELVPSQLPAAEDVAGPTASAPNTRSSTVAAPASVKSSSTERQLSKRFKPPRQTIAGTPADVPMEGAPADDRSEETVIPTQGSTVGVPLPESEDEPQGTAVLLGLRQSLLDHRVGGHLIAEIDARVAEGQPVRSDTTNGAKRVAKSAETFVFDTSAFGNMFDRSVLNHLTHAGREEMDLYTEPLSEADAQTLMENMRTLDEHTPVRFRSYVYTRGYLTTIALMLIFTLYDLLRKPSSVWRDLQCGKLYCRPTWLS